MLDYLIVSLLFIMGFFGIFYCVLTHIPVGWFEPIHDKDTPTSIQILAPTTLHISVCTPNTREVMTLATIGTRSKIADIKLYVYNKTLVLPRPTLHGRSIKFDIWQYCNTNVTLPESVDVPLLSYFFYRYLLQRIDSLRVTATDQDKRTRTIFYWEYKEVRSTYIIDIDRIIAKMMRYRRLQQEDRDQQTNRNMPENRRRGASPAPSHESSVSAKTPSISISDQGSQASVRRSPRNHNPSIYH